MMRAIEVTGTVDNGGRLLLEGRLPIEGIRRVRVLILVDESNDEMEEVDWLAAASRNTSFDFLRDPGEDLYLETDGEPFDAQG